MTSHDHKNIKNSTSLQWFMIVKLQSQSKKFRINIAYFAYVINFVINFVDLSHLWSCWKSSARHFNTFFLILTQFNTHYESMWDFIYCNERCASVTLFLHQESLLSALYTITIFNARTLWVCWSIMRFICIRCWLRIFCKLCLSEELNNLINIDRAVTTLYLCIEFTHSRKAKQ